MAAISSVPRFSSLPILLSLRLNSSAAGPEGIHILPVLLDLSVEIRITVLIIRQSGNKVVELGSDGIRIKFIPRSRINLKGQVKLEISRPVNFKFRRSLVFRDVLIQGLCTRLGIRESSYLIGSGPAMTHAGFSFALIVAERSKAYSSVGLRSKTFME